MNRFDECTWKQTEDDIYDDLSSEESELGPYVTY